MKNKSKADKKIKLHLLVTSINDNLGKVRPLGGFGLSKEQKRFKKAIKQGKIKFDLSLLRFTVKGKKLKTVPEVYSSVTEALNIK